MAERPTSCQGSQAFPTNYDGETTRCDECGRTLRLHINGRLPRHNPARPAAPKLLPRGEAVIDGRRAGGPQNPGPAQ